MARGDDREARQVPPQVGGRDRGRRRVAAVHDARRASSPSRTKGTHTRPLQPLRQWEGETEDDEEWQPCATLGATTGTYTHTHTHTHTHTRDAVTASWPRRPKEAQGGKEEEEPWRRRRWSRLELLLFPDAPRNAASLVCPTFRAAAQARCSRRARSRTSRTWRRTRPRCCARPRRGRAGAARSAARSSPRWTRGMARRASRIASLHHEHGTILPRSSPR